MLPRRNQGPSYINSIPSIHPASAKKYLQRELPAVPKLISLAEQYNANKVPSSSNSYDLLTLLEYTLSLQTEWIISLVPSKRYHQKLQSIQDAICLLARGQPSSAPRSECPGFARHPCPAALLTAITQQRVCSQKFSFSRYAGCKLPHFGSKRTVRRPLWEGAGAAPPVTAGSSRFHSRPAPGQSWANRGSLWSPSTNQRSLWHLWENSLKRRKCQREERRRHGGAGDTPGRSPELRRGLGRKEQRTSEEQGAGES